MRRASFRYDDSYPGEPLPVIVVEFRKQANSTGLVLDLVIPDTGADASALPWADCQQLQLDPSNGVPSLMGGVGETSLATIVFYIYVLLGGNNYVYQLQADFSGHELIFGRDVLNRMEVMFCGPAQEVIFNT